eukprot:TRINITY_DN61812_c0_g1_i2.p4 TRINITY_DN61812_c0_g1~~TRINITY_DN61812_c0_g1_i2.p4  ORF type:complete len:118 (-),score=17.75 TRINITY_DN61812_c0_g1_i2:283-636(-)
MRSWGGCVGEGNANASSLEKGDGILYAAMVREDGFKLVIGQGDGHGKCKSKRLYNVRTDPGETTDLANTTVGVAVVAEMVAAVQKEGKTASMAHDRDPIDPRSDPRLHGGVWMPWEH